GVLRIGDPVGQRLARRLVEPPLRVGGVGDARLNDLLAVGKGDLLLVGLLALRLDEVAALVGANAREEGGEGPELLLLPVGERVVVTLGTLQADAEEQPGRRRPEVLRLQLLAQVEGRGTACPSPRADEE